MAQTVDVDFEDIAEAAPLGTRSPGGSTVTELAEMAVSGELAAAELELHQWQRQPDCPPAARVMLAGLLARRDQLDHAATVLDHVQHAALDHLDAREAQLLVTILVRTSEADRARRLTRKLHDAFGDRSEVRAWLQRMEAPGTEALPDVAEARIEHLAAELAAQPEVIPSLVVAQQHSPDAAQITLLRQALARLAPTLSEGPHWLALCRAQARLSLLAGDSDEARRWAHRGLKQAPEDEKLALVLAEIADNPTVGPPARDVLARVVDAHPDYPDVRRALIRRHAGDGQRQSARELLAQWLNREPDSPIALALDKELAA
jgi:hypothetical protein